ncbi:MAG TPA: hypothetical protein PKD85_09000 [Saprospiraceae bacterium]|nr:hypothetical protein [Saprospiraceae bacterium]
MKSKGLKFFQVFSILFLSYQSVFGQISDLRGGGAHNIGTVRFQNLSTGLYGIYGNFASTSLSNQNSYADLSAIFRYHDIDFGEYSFAYVYRKNYSSFGATLVQFGAEDYFERKIQLSYARKMFSNGGLGLNFNLMNIQNAELGTTFTPTIDVSFYSSINNKLDFASSVRNVLKTKNDIIHYPPILAIALFYKISKVLQVGIEGVQIIDRPFDLKLLFEYNPSNQINFHLGLDILNQNIGLGFAYQLGGYRLGLSTGQSNRLPMSSGVSFGYLK